MNFPARIFAFIAIICCFAAAHYSAHARVVKYSSGTGFFVTQAGLLITNAHVVRDCTKLTVLTNNNIVDARITGLDEEHDLALIQANVRSAEIAPLRFNLSHMRVGQKVAVAGYPGNSGFRGDLVYRTAKLLGFEGPVGEPHFLQFTPTAEKGNSGGPLLDHAGNVVGVVTGKTKLYETNPTSPNAQPILVKEADIAVTLPFLKEFLKRHKVRTSYGGSGLIKVNKRYIAQEASQFIVHVRCAKS